MANMIFSSLPNSPGADGSLEAGHCKNSWLPAKLTSSVMTGKIWEAETHSAVASVSLPRFLKVP
jgi:hypothetical protein